MRHWEDSLTPDSQTRIVFHDGWSACSTIYITSAQGAAKALYHMSMIPYSKTVDLGMGRIWRILIRVVFVYRVIPHS